MEGCWWLVVVGCLGVGWCEGDVVLVVLFVLLGCVVDGVVFY